MPSHLNGHTAAPQPWNIIVTKDELFDAKAEFGHDTNRIAEALVNCRKAITEVENLRAADLALLNAKIHSAEQKLARTDEAAKLGLTQLSDQSRVIAEQEKEIENYARQAGEMKELLATLQHKYVALQEDHKSHLASALTREQAQLGYVEKNQAFLIEHERMIHRLERYEWERKKLVEENDALMTRINDRWVWKRVKAAFSWRIRLRYGIGEKNGA